MSSTASAFTFIPLGAIIQEFQVAGQNIVLGFPTQEQYIEYNTPHFGATIGRVANRIKDAVIHNLNGRDYTFAKNNGPNSLHGGVNGWGKRIFDGPHTVKHNGKEALLFKYLSKDGEEGYPGTVELRVWYTASKEDIDGPAPKTVLSLEYEVEFVGDECEETVINLTNHSYFNIANAPTVTGTKAQLFTQSYLPLDSTGIPIGNIEAFPREVTAPFDVGPFEPHIDDVFVMESDPEKIPLDTRGQSLKLLAQFSHATTRMHLEVHSTEPAFQFYTGKYIDVPAVEGAPARVEGAGFCVEPSRFVNAANVPKWRSMCVLKRGEIFGCRNVYKAWKD
ncbi:hypothetical protein ASPWEDRAFT_112787 [Aspergillus wentii DTO 134E9]|uniref:Aldose 1-epimerase n=1 Tax=Aspergillus wentii DTO 134E9 TaxID=1073089 RepID=A0A1L9RH53_ASPWE|nr:uncharacterized protein ASPWEDRAFT_112787 [Aspergillus wentii DTO 134E9]KAI9928044.1 hypothetical protein MW887_002896 [Aspergillus wentii]OJJ34269.1 hypothetical protein ASPWEDRAFT_112787 [Aspergillus wentii DTO 134E9]